MIATLNVVTKLNNIKKGEKNENFRNEKLRKVS